MPNRQAGEVALQLGGATRIIVFDWQALARVQAELGQDVLGLVLGGLDLPKLAKLLEIGLARHHDAINAAQVTALSPPLMPTITAVRLALDLAYWGPQGAPDEAPEKPANPLARMAIWLRKLSRRPLPAGSRHPTSGG